MKKKIVKKRQKKIKKKTLRRCKSLPHQAFIEKPGQPCVTLSSNSIQIRKDCITVLNEF